MEDFDKKIRKEVIEEMTGSEVGSLIEIRNTYYQYEKCMISKHPRVLFPLSEDADDKLKLINAYEIHKIHKNKLYIVGVNPLINKKSKKFQFYSASTNEIKPFFSLISLVHEPIDMNNLKKSFEDKEIIEWCETYTLPNCHKSTKFEECYTENCFVYNYMLLDSFYEVVTELYLLFQLWKSDIYEEKDSIKKYALMLISDETKYGIDINGADAANIILSYFIDIKIKGIINLRFVNFGKNKLHLDTSSFSSMFYFQLANLITKPQESKKHLKNCRSCGNYYWGHGNSFYCENCDRRTAWSRRKRQAKNTKEV